jgi:hypothetical protein
VLLSYSVVQFESAKRREAAELDARRQPRVSEGWHLLTIDHSPLTGNAVNSINFINLVNLLTRQPVN